MKTYVVIILATLFFTNNAFTFPKRQVDSFIAVLKQPSKESIKDFLNSYPDSPFSPFLKEVLFDISTQEYIDELKNTNKCYLKLKAALVLLEEGLDDESEKLFKEVFEKSNFYDEVILINYPGNRKELLSDSILKQKVKTALKERDFDKASLYLHLIKRKDYEYELLKAKLLLKTGRKREAIKLLRKNPSPEAKFYLIFLEQETEKKLENLNFILNSNIEKEKKISALKFLLDRSLIKNLSLFRKLVEKLKSLNTKLYKEYKAKYFIRTADFKRAKQLLSELKGEKYKAWETAIRRKFFREKVKFNSESLSFYRFMLSEKPLSMKWREPDENDIKDTGIRYIVENKHCYLLEFLDENSLSKLDLAIANYMCGNYQKAIRLASRFKNKMEKLPFLLPILYPMPSIFKNDVLSLSIARQESLFNKAAVSKSGAIGLMQIMPKTGSYIAKRLNIESFSIHMLYNEKINYRFGSFYISELVRKTKSLPIAVASYNAGPTRMKKIASNFWDLKSNEDLILFVDVFIPISETRNYVKKVISNYFIYKFLMEKRICRRSDESTGSKEHIN
jgi:soluble lytic murein transglycosylase